MSQAATHLRYKADALSAVCRQYGVRKLSVFGSAVREDFRPDSDVDVRVEFSLASAPGLLHFAVMKAELEQVFGHEVDVATPEILRNPYRRAAITKDLVASMSPEFRDPAPSVGHARRGTSRHRDRRWNYFHRIPCANSLSNARWKSSARLRAASARQPAKRTRRFPGN
ncbi:MAG: nucleotidyltransferase family protein [Thiomonas sp.]